MNLSNVPIRRKLTIIMLLVSLIAMVLMWATFLTVDYVRLKHTTIHQLETLAEITATNSTAALAFQNQDDAREILSSLAADKHIVAACLFDQKGKPFAVYPGGLSPGSLPASPGNEGFGDDGSFLSGFQPVGQGGNKRLGMLYLKFDTTPILSAWLRQSLELSPAIFGVILLVAFLLSRELQRQISQPILDIANVAKVISEQQDYSVRVQRLGSDELGQLSGAFNRMLAQIQKQNQSITESEAQLKTIIENLSEGLAVSDMSGKLIHLNRAALGVYGFATLEEAQTQMSRLTEIFELSTLEGTVLTPEQWPLKRVLAGEVLGDLELRIQGSPTVSSKILKFGGTLVRDANAQPIMAVLTIEDITQRKLVEMEVHQLNNELEHRVTQRTAQLEIAKKNLEEANNELESFSYSVSHDLRAPLRHIDGFAGLLGKSVAAFIDDNGRRYLTTISASAKQMGRLIDDLLAFSRTGRTDLRRSQIDHDALVAEVIRDGAASWGSRVITWHISPLPRVDADLAMLRQVWANLIENAVKYSGKSENPCIEIGSSVDFKGSGQVFFVKDNGVGFNMKYVDKLFGVFQRLHTTAEFEGTGIGLANVRRIISRHGGRTWAEGEIGKGATIFFSLPTASNVSAAA